MLSMTKLDDFVPANHLSTRRCCMYKTIAFNGKFFGAEVTGVHRVAEQLIAATDALIAEHSAQGAEYALVIRNSVKVPSYRNILCVRESPLVRRMHRIAWEQAY